MHPGVRLAWRVVLVPLLIATAAASSSHAQGRRSERVPEVLLLHGDRLVAARLRVRAGDALLAPVMQALRAEAKVALTSGPWETIWDQPPPYDVGEPVGQTFYRLSLPCP